MFDAVYFCSLANYMKDEEIQMGILYPSINR